MSEQKKQAHIFNAETESQLGGLHLVRASNPLVPGKDKGQLAHREFSRKAGKSTGESQSARKEVVLKLIDFFRSI
jgi:hypothetical protein